MTPKIITTSPRQIWAHLLCLECEGRLNKFGETPVLKLLDNGRGFPLLERMNLALTLKVEANTVSFSGSAMGIDTDALAYFSLGFLWKGSCLKWKTLRGQTTFIKLGPYRESIRTYLLGKTGFPAGVFVIVAACEDKGSRGMVFPPAKVSGSLYPMFSILVRGIWFHVITDKKAAPKVKHLCSVQSEQRILHLKDCRSEFFEAGRFLRKNAVVSPELVATEMVSILECLSLLRLFGMALAGPPNYKLFSPEDAL
jgi:hypothetical protein